MSLPLSLDLAGSFVFESSISFKDYLTRFDDEFPSLMGSQPPKAVWQYEKTTFTTWEISFQRLGEQAQKLLLLCGFFNNDEISLEILLPKEKMAEFGIGSCLILLFRLLGNEFLTAKRKQMPSMQR